MKISTFYILVLLLVASLPCFALNYTISFTGTGASTTVESVIVQNLTKGTTVTVPAGNVLNLSDAPNAVGQVSANDETIRVYPASVGGKSILSFFSKQAGSTQLNAFSLDGRKVTGINTDLQAGSNTFELSLPKGVFVIQVTGNEYSYTAKMINQSASLSKPEIVYTGTEKPASTSPQKTKSSILGTTTMAYTAGDQLLYKGISGNYSTIVTDRPTGSKTTNFNFAACTDADGNSYNVVTIGTQTWMAENLKTTQYNDGTTIPNVTDNTWGNLTTPGYCWYNNDATTYKNKYGALYNWYTVNTGKLAPKGWHVPMDAEWTNLENYLTANGYNYDGSTSGDYYAKSLAATTDWAIDTYTDAGAIGNDLSKNNRTGFSALPGGYRYSYDGTFNGIGIYGFWWSSTDGNSGGAWRRNLEIDISAVGRISNSAKQNGFSVRCVRDSQ
jgi:uncharacterized protein (TIGR02145 family)